MKKLILLTVCAIWLIGDASAQFRAIENTIKMIRAGSNTAKALSLSDSDVRRLSRELREQLDAEWKLIPADSALGERLAKMTEKIVSVDGITLNYGVYDLEEVNAYAFGDGSVRITAGLMNLMDDNEVLAVVGHELGHIYGKDTKETMKNAFYTAALKDASSLVSDELMKDANSEWIKVADAFTKSQFSQKQELAADDYAFKFCLDRGMDPYAMANALDKLVELSKSDKKSTVEQMFSSHPDTEKRAKRMREKADEYTSR